jgi:hypothetical protein
MVLRSGPRRPRLARVGAWFVDVASANAGRAVYGAVMVGVLLAAENARHEGYPATIEAAVIVLVLYWLTSFYTHALGERLRRREALTPALLWRSCIYELPVIEGALIPVLVLLATWATGFTVDSGARAALWVAAGCIVVLEVVAGLRSRLGVRGLSLQAGGGAVIGLTLVGLKLVLH